ncbi:hypothetical protein JZ949_10020 [Riemerella anatipestifer]|uniref:Uncharacterized protein n=1 Tax=Riemerella anatipestifer TaxID=34085 RepID=A0AAP6HH62_RIEAN|nr:hypothetical protein [Riemerella anatipestifer]MBT0527124.1 hypothetical protein [Riemerella anatipestifer]MDY3513543.1 hypothetical protein [Riemerella anatipestifer]WFS34618.1 hypothetical protein AWN91_009495 [Riemerella anatipestifer]
MKPNLPQPFEQEDIRKDPKAVVIGLLIGLLLMFGSVIGVLFNRREEVDENCKDRIFKLYDTILVERNKRIYFYERMIFYQKENKRLQKQDSLIKSNTEPLINKIYKYEK